MFSRSWEKAIQLEGHVLSIKKHNETGQSAAASKPSRPVIHLIIC